MIARNLTILFVLMTVTAAAEEKSKSPDAETLMIRAHASRATWAGFPGFTADLVVAENEQKTTGKLSASSSGKLSLELSDSLDWVHSKLQSLVAHRTGTAAQKYDVSFADINEEHPLGHLIKINDDSLMGSQYRIQDDVIREVHRAPHNVKFSITVLEVQRNANGKYLPKYYTVSFWDRKTGELQSTSVVLDDWKRVGEWDLPTRLLTIESKDQERNVKDIQLNNHRLLPEEQASK